MQVPYVIVCGEVVNYPNVIYHENAGKWDAINFALQYLPEDSTMIVLNDVDTEIHNFETALLRASTDDLVYCSVQVSFGPQMKFYRLLNPIRSVFHIAASGELMIMKKAVFKDVLPLPPCIAEDSYMLFKALELGYRVNFCKSAYVTTERTHNAEEEASYKKRTTYGIYQALDTTKPPPIIRLFYIVLPIIAPLLSLAGEDGRSWSRGINKAIKDRVTKKRITRF